MLHFCSNNEKTERNVGVIRYERVGQALISWHLGWACETQAKKLRNSFISFFIQIRCHNDIMTNAGCKRKMETQDCDTFFQLIVRETGIRMHRFEKVWHFIWRRKNFLIIRHYSSYSTRTLWCTSPFLVGKLLYPCSAFAMDTPDAISVVLIHRRIPNDNVLYSVYADILTHLRKIWICEFRTNYRHYCLCWGQTLWSA